MSKYKDNIEEIGRLLFNWGNGSTKGITHSQEEWAEISDKLLAL